MTENVTPGGKPNIDDHTADAAAGYAETVQRSSEPTRGNLEAAAELVRERVAGFTVGAPARADLEWAADLLERSAAENSHPRFLQNLERIREERAALERAEAAEGRIDELQRELEATRNRLNAREAIDAAGWGAYLISISSPPDLAKIRDDAAAALEAMGFADTARAKYDAEAADLLGPVGGPEPVPTRPDLEELAFRLFERWAPARKGGQYQGMVDGEDRERARSAFRAARVFLDILEAERTR